MIKLNLNKRLDSAEGEMNLKINIDIDKGEFVTLYGESGAGKTSILRMISGLMVPDGGRIEVAGSVWYDGQTKTNLSPQERQLGMVFQDYALFPHMTVRENLNFALKKHQRHDVITELIEIVGLSKLQDRKPLTLSGGQMQRVAIARALVPRPSILLLDEPLSALDTKIRIQLQDYILALHREFKLTTILISHNLSEIFKLSDRVIQIGEGKVMRQGSPSSIFINQDVSGKFKFAGEVIAIEAQEVLYIITVLIQSQIVKVVADMSEVANLSIGDQVMVASKAFNPLIYKIET